MKRFSFKAFVAVAFLHIAGTAWLISATISPMHASDHGDTFPWLTSSVVDLDAGSYVGEPSFPLCAGALFLLSCATVVALRCTLLRIHYPILFALATPLA